jgi:hypothetical protein
MPGSSVILALKWLSGGASALLGLLRRYPWQCVVIALMALSGWLWRGKQHVLAELHVAQAQIKAGEQNVAALKAEKARIEREQAAITERIDHETAPAQKDALAAGDAYAASHRCVQPSAVATASSAGSGVPSTPAAARSAEAPAPVTDMVAVAKPDFDACTLNSADLEKAYEWAAAVYGAR